MTESSEEKRQPDMQPYIPSYIEDKLYFQKDDGRYVSIEMDPYPENPRTFSEPLGTFLTWGGDFISPDSNPYPTAIDFAEATLGEKTAHSYHTMQDILQAFDEAGYAARGIYRFKHGQVSYQLGEQNPFADRWDSGAVGFAIVSPEKLKAEGMSKEQAISCMESEMWEYSDWVNGSVYIATEYDDKGMEQDTFTFYGLDGFKQEYPSLQTVDLGDFTFLEDYVEHQSLTHALEKDWTFHPPTNEWPHTAYVKDVMAIVSTNKTDTWRIVNQETEQVSFAVCHTPEEALKELGKFQKLSKEELDAFIPPKMPREKEKPLDVLKQEAKDRVAEKNEAQEKPAKGAVKQERKPLEIDH